MKQRFRSPGPSSFAVYCAIVACVGTSMFTTETTYAQQLLYANVELRGPNGECLEIRNMPGNGTTPLMFTCFNSPQQLWDIYADGRIVNQLEGRCLDLRVYSNGTVSFERLQIWDCDQTQNARWIVPTSATGVIRNAANNRCITARGQITTEPCNPGDDRQQFHRTETYGGAFDEEWIRIFDAMCYSSSSCSHRDRLIDIRNELVRTYGQKGAGSDNRYYASHADVGLLLWDLAQRNLFYYEKGFIWTLIARNDDGPMPLVVLDAEAHPQVIDSGVLSPTSAHTVMPFDDGYHGAMVRWPLEEAYAEILRHESDSPSCLPWCPNRGDIEASLRTVIALKELDRTRDFRRYARYWWGLFVDQEHSFCDGRVYDDGCTALGLGPLLQPTLGSVSEEQWCALQPCDFP